MALRIDATNLIAHTIRNQDKIKFCGQAACWSKRSALTTNGDKAPMAATKTVSHRAGIRKSAQLTIFPITPRYGVVTLFGYGIRVRVERGHLILEDGIGEDRREGRFARVGHSLDRVIVIGADGMVWLAALRWLADQNAAFIMLDRIGAVLAVTGPVRPSDARLRRAQARADLSGAALVIGRELISRKLFGQEQLAREAFRDGTTADSIAGYRTQLAAAPDIKDVRRIEAQAAQLYWSVWRDLPVTFPKTDLPRVPEHWRTFDARRSPLTGSPRRAVNPPNAMLNYLYAILEAESRLALAAMGLDPGLGFIHADEENRDNLACDLMEAVRPHVDAFVLDWIRRAPLKREWLFEERSGNCRLMAEFAAKLGETATMWRNAVAPIAEWIATTLWSSIRNTRGKRGPATRLTQSRIRKARGVNFVPEPKALVVSQSVCLKCGISIKPGRKYCPSCNVVSGTEEVMKAAPLGWAATQSARAQAQRSETKRRHDAEKKAWDPASHPAWLTEQAYRRKVQSLLANVQTFRIASAIGVTWAYASNIRKGKRLPHPRHWQKLADLVGVSAS
jgi:CRISPR-associated endonuclease Cas1